MKNLTVIILEDFLNDTVVIVLFKDDPEKQYNTDIEQKLV